MTVPGFPITQFPDDASSASPCGAAKRPRRSMTCGLRVILMAMAAGIIHGCASDSKAPETPEWPRTTARPAGDRPNTDDPLDIGRGMDDLERQAHADAQWLEERRLAAAQRGQTASAAQEPEGPRRPEIFFNDPPVSRHGHSRSAEPAGAPPMGRPETRPDDRSDITGADPSEEPASRRSSDPDRVISSASDDFPVLLVRLRQELMEQSHRSSQPLRELIAMATMAIVDPDFQLEPDAFRGLTEAERDQLRHFQHFFRHLGRSLDGSTHSDEVIAEALSTLRDALAPAPQLTLRAAELCYSVDGFGAYTPFDPRRFLAMEQQEAIIYLEIDGLHATQNERGEWVTRLSQEVRIYGARDQIPVWSEPWQSTVDRTVNRRRDFYTVWLIRFPRALAVGEYFLKVRIRDDQTLAEADVSIPFEMVADPRMIGRPQRK